ncbi:MAG: hypothetical protein AB2765_07910 [Candidatus Thiodiazotropha endolucinida]
MAIKQPGYLENKAELTQAGQGASAPSPSLCDAWGAVTALERDNAVLLGLGGSVESSNKDQLYASRNEEMTKQEKERAQTRNSDMMLLALLDQIADMEAGIAAEYGENFAMDMIESLYLKGKITEEERDTIASMQNLGDQRHAAAILVQQKKQDGIVTDEDLKEFGWATDEYFDLHVKSIEGRNAQITAEQKGEISTNDMATSAKDEAANRKAFKTSQNTETTYEHATVEKEENNNTHDSAGNTLVAGLGSGPLDL